MPQGVRGELHLGLFCSLGAVPASIRVALVSARCRGEGRPLAFEEKVGLFFVCAVLTYLVAFASLILFAATCAPIGMASNNMPVAFGVGGLAALAGAIGGARVVVRVTRHMAGLEPKRRGPRPG